MNANLPPQPSEVFERYALGLARTESLPSGSGDHGRCDALLAELKAHGVKGWPERRTLYTRRLPAGCGPCLEGMGSNLCLTTLCNRDCFFCFNPRPRTAEMSVHGRKVSEEAKIPEILEEYGVRSLGLSGGEPLLDPAKVLRVVRQLRDRFGPGLRIDLYTNGELLTPKLLARLRRTGLDALRINLVASGYRTSIVEMAKQVFADVEVEIPAIPEHGDRLRRLVDELDALGAPHLVLHELFCSAQNLDALRLRGYQAAQRGLPEDLTWGPVSGSEETALEILLYALDSARTLNVYYCSTGTQQWIAERALARRQAAPAAMS